MGLRKRGGENSPISPPLDPRLKGSSESFFVQYLKSTGSNIRLGPSSYHLSVESVLLDLGHHHQDDRVMFSGVKLTSMKSTIYKLC